MPSLISISRALKLAQAQPSWAIGRTFSTQTQPNSLYVKHRTNRIDPRAWVGSLRVRGRESFGRDMAIGHGQGDRGRGGERRGFSLQK